jgi:hypothetical protein
MNYRLTLIILIEATSVSETMKITKINSEPNTLIFKCAFVPTVRQK